MSNTQEAQLETILVLIERQQETIENSMKEVHDTTGLYGKMLTATGEQARQTKKLAEEVQGTRREWDMTTARLERLINVFPWKLATILSLAIGVAVGALGIGWYFYITGLRSDAERYRALARDLDRHFVTDLYGKITSGQRDSIDALYRENNAQPPSLRWRTK